MPALSDLAVVIPLGPNEQAWRELLPALRSRLPAEAQLILVAVSGAHAPGLDAACVGAVGTARTKLIDSAAGRGRQLNAGIAASDRPWLWLLHADSRLTASTLPAIEALADPCLGYFDLGFHDGGLATRFTSLGAWLRSRWLGLPFGDQGFLLPRTLFESLGRFDETLSGGEDHALVWAARRAGVRLRPLRAPLLTSARKYRERGWWRTTAQHWRLTWQQARRFSRTPS